MSVFGNNRSLRCVLFHDVSDHTTPFTKGLGVTISTTEFEARIRYLAKHYTPVSFQDLLDRNGSGSWPCPPVLVTFDDVYASVLENAAPICRKYNVPALFFLNASCLGNTTLSLDNLVCYAANRSGMPVVNAAARQVRPELNGNEYSLSQIFGTFLPGLSLGERKAFQDSLIAAAGIRPGELASEAGLYLTEEQLHGLITAGFEIGDHTYSHVHCRALSSHEFREEIDANRIALEQITGNKVRAFSIPYGSSSDYTPELEGHLRRCGYDAAFLVESLPNRFPLDFHRLYRVSVHSKSDRDLFVDLEVLPYLRVVRNRLLRRPIRDGIMG